MVRLPLALGFLVAGGCCRRSDPVAVVPAPADPPPVTPAPVLAGEFAGKPLQDWETEIRSGDAKRHAIGLSAA